MHVFSRCIDSGIMHYVLVNLLQLLNAVTKFRLAYMAAAGF